MLGLRQFLIYLSAFSCLLYLASCAEQSAPVNEEKEVVEVGSEEGDVIEDQVHHQVPSPHEMMEFIKSSGGEFNANFLCGTDVAEKYVDLKGKAMGLGVYIADLAYTSSYSEFQESIKYFNVVVRMSEDLGIASVFDKSMLNRIENNLDHPDSLEAISNESYYSIIADLEASDRGKVVAMVAAGGFIESLFIALQSVDKFDKDNAMIKRIAGQKLVYENIMAYLDKYKDDQAVEWAIMDMTALKAPFDDISDTRRDTKFSEGNDGKVVLGGSGGVYMMEQEFEELRHQATFLRNALTFNNVQPQ